MKNKKKKKRFSGPFVGLLADCSVQAVGWKPCP